MAAVIHKIRCNNSVLFMLSYNNSVVHGRLAHDCPGLCLHVIYSRENEQRTVTDVLYECIVYYINIYICIHSLSYLMPRK